MTIASRHGSPRWRSGSPRRFVDAASDALSAIVAYLPVVLMGLLALGTWWLVRNTPVPETPRESGPPSGEPDYAMERFQVQRFGPEGKLRAHIDGDRMRHFPHTDTLLIDGPRVRTIDSEGRVTLAQARQARSNGDGSELKLEGTARVLRQAHAGEPAIEFVGEEIEASRRTQQIVARKPVTVVRNGTVIRGDSLVYDYAAGVLSVTGQVRASFGGRLSARPGDPPGLATPPAVPAVRRPEAP